MSVKTLAEIKSAFETGDKPTGQDFIDLIDTLHDDTTGLVHTNRTLLDAYTGPVDLSGYATLTNVDARINAIVGAAPAALDTLQEIATQLAADESATAAIVTNVSTKAPQATTYTKTEVDTAINAKANQATTYSKAEVDSSIAGVVATQLGVKTKSLVMTLNDTTTVSGTSVLAVYTAVSGNITPVSATEQSVVNGSWTAAKLYDGNTGTGWQSLVVQGLPQWAKYDMGANVIAASYSLTDQDVNGQQQPPQSWYLDGSTDNVNWTRLDTQTATNAFLSTTQMATKLCPIATPGSYRYYRLTITAINRGVTVNYGLDLREWNLQSAGVYYQKTIPTDFLITKPGTGAQTITITKLAAGSAQTLIEYL